MGFDSLFLSQVTQQLLRDFKVKLTFRQLLGDFSTIPALVAHLAENLPPEIAAPAAPALQPAEAQLVAASRPISATPQGLSSPQRGVVGSDAVEQVIRDQLDVMSRLMAQQLEALRGVGATAQSQSAAAMRQPQTIAPATAPASVATPASVSAPQDEPKSRFDMIAAARSAPAAEMNEIQQSALAELTLALQWRARRSQSA